ncbi:ABC transporter ATP-binding protein [Roseburia hominis]
MEQAEKIKKKQMADSQRKIIARNLVKDYELKEKRGLFRPRTRKTVHAVKGVSLEIPRGKIIGLLGINGAGKMTTIRMLSSVIEPTAGTLEMEGIDAIKEHRRVKERINVISDGERNLYWRLTAVENLEYFGSLYGISGDTLKKRIRNLLRIVDLEEAADIPVERYSKGMKQRLQIARGLVNDPAYIFLDEPTLGLDIVIAKEIRELIRRLAAEKEKGVLLTTHYISEAEELCDYIYVIDHGKIIARGTKEELQTLFAPHVREAKARRAPLDSDPENPKEPEIPLEDILMYLVNEAKEEEK